jgi:hypothetical protein
LEYALRRLQNTIRRNEALKGGEEGEKGDYSTRLEKRQRVLPASGLKG